MLSKHISLAYVIERTRRKFTRPLCVLQNHRTNCDASYRLDSHNYVADNDQPPRLYVCAPFTARRRWASAVCAVVMCPSVCLSQVGVLPTGLDELRLFRAPESILSFTNPTLCCKEIPVHRLPPGRGDIPAFTPAEAGTRLSDLGGMQG